MAQTDARTQLEQAEVVARIVARTAKIRARDVVRRCSACEQPGHYRVTCPHLAGPRLDHRGPTRRRSGL